MHTIFIVKITAYKYQQDLSAGNKKRRRSSFFY